MMAQGMIIYIFMIKVNNLFSFLKEIENIFSVFLSSYRNTSGSLEEHKKVVERLTCRHVFYNISRSPKLPLVFQSITQ